MPGTRKLGKTTDQRMAMLRQQVTDFLDNGRMETTFTRAKEIGAMAEKMITLGKKKDLAAYRQALSIGFTSKMEPTVLPLATKPEPTPIHIAFVCGPDGEEVEFFKEV